MNESKIVNSASLFKAGLSLAEEGKRKANGSLEPNKVEPSSSGPTILADQGQRNLKSSREQKGNSIKAFYRDKNQASSSTTSTVQFSSFNASFPSSINFRDSSFNSNGTFNGNFKFSSEARKEKSSHNGGSGMETDGATSVDLLIGQPGKDNSKIRSLEDCVSAISNTILMRIQPEVDTGGEKDAIEPSHLDRRNGEQELAKLQDRAQLLLGCKRDDDGSALTVCLTHTEEGLLQKTDTSDQMDFEGGGVSHAYC